MSLGTGPCGADGSVLTGLRVLAELGAEDDPFSERITRFSPSAQSGEINTPVKDAAKARARIIAWISSFADIDEFDGLTVTGRVTDDEPFWRFTVRLSDTEPLLRLNVEAETVTQMKRVRNAALELIRSAARTG